MKEEEIIAILSHLYFNHILNDVKPFLKYFDNAQITAYFNKLKDTVDSEVLERLFFMACLQSSDISIPFNYKQKDTNSSLEKNEWLTNLESFGIKSKQGMVIKSLIFNNFYIVIKKAKNSKFNEITLRDFCVGINLNKILNEAPFFVRTLGCFQYKNQFHIATEFIDGISLKTFIKNKSNTFTDFLNIFFQILLGLELAQNKLNFSHYDLHSDNVILVPLNQIFTVSLYGYNYIIKHNYKPIMIDFGLSSIHTKGKTLGQTSLETKGIYNYLSPGYDIYVFLLFCLDISQNSNLSIFKGITDLLMFFKNETNLSMELLTSNHIKSLRKGICNLIPNQFIQYMVQNYSVYLNVDIEPQKYNHQCLIKEPIFLKLKKIIDINDELEPVISNKINKGFIKALIENIKIYYWYKKKINLEQDVINKLILMDEINLQNLIYDLNLEFDNKITTKQKNLFFTCLEYYYLIIELELHHQYPFYKQWMNNFRETYVYKNMFVNFDNVLFDERIQRIEQK